jgi:hypothetical protein
MAFQFAALGISRDLTTNSSPEGREECDFVSRKGV